MMILLLFPVLFLFLISYNAYGTTNQTMNIFNETFEAAESAFGNISLDIIPESAEFTELHPVSIVAMAPAP